jgi:hypothetical protein
MSLKRIAALAVTLAVGCAGTASAGVKIQLFQAGVLDSVGLTADHQGNVYVLSEFAYISKVTPDGHGTNLPFTLPVLSDSSQQARKLVWGPDDTLWFLCNQVTCHVDADGGGLIDSPSYGYGAPGIDGSFWSADPVARTVTRMTPAGVATVFQGLPSGCTTVGPMIPGPDQSMWFLCDHTLVSVTSNGTLTTRALPSQFVPYGPLAVGSDGNLWMTIDYGIARVSPDGRVLGQYSLGADPASLALGPDGDMWFTYFSAGGVGRVSPSGHVSDYSDQIGPGQDPAQIVLAADGGLWVDAFWRDIVWRIDPDPPAALTEAPGGIRLDTATLNATVDPRGGPTTAYFEWGTTSAYGTQTASDDVGDGDAGVLTSATLTGLAPDTTYHYRVVAVNGRRTVLGADRTLTTADAPVSGPPPVEPARALGETRSDADGDGYPAGVDCNDHAVSIHPGAIDRPGDAIDQDCSGTAAPWGHLAPPVDARWATHGTTTTFTRLTIGALPAKTTLMLDCRGSGCAFKSYTLKTRRAAKHTNLLEQLNHARLRRDTQITLRFSASGQATTVIRWHIGPPTRRTTTCLAPHAHKEMPCA